MATLSRGARRRSNLAALALAALLAPAGASAAGRPSPGKLENGRFSSGKPAAAAYGPGAPCPSGSAFNLVADDLAREAKSAGRAVPEPDGRLCDVAEALLAWDLKDRPRDAVLEFTSRWSGLAAPAQEALIVTLETDDSNTIGENVRDAAADFVARATAPRWGFATLRLPKERGVVRTRVALVASDAMYDVTGPRRLEAGKQGVLSGKVFGPWESPSLAVSDAAGGASTVAEKPGKEFSAEVRCGDKPGWIWVEVRARKSGGDPRAIGAIPVACGKAPPGSVAIAPEPWPADQAQREKKLLDEQNAERVQAGLAPLAADEALVATAREMAQALATGGGVGDVRERLKKAGIVAPLVLQSAASERSAARVAERLQQSPSSRANAMNPTANKVGVGFVEATGDDGKPLVHVAELFVQEPPPPDAEKVRGQLREAVAQKRKDARTNALAEDATLDDVAQKYAAALAAAGGTLPKEQGQALTKPLDSSWKSVAVVAGAKPDALDFAEEPPVAGKGTGLGVGVASGRHPSLGRNTAYVVILVGTPRDAGGPKAAGSKPTKGGSGAGKK
jgi:uncharacterized protein YkwD